MKKQSGPFKLKYKKSAFPFMENFHVKKHGKLKIVRGKSTKDEIDEILNEGMELAEDEDKKSTAKGRKRIEEE